MLTHREFLKIFLRQKGEKGIAQKVTRKEGKIENQNETTKITKMIYQIDLW